MAPVIAQAIFRFPSTLQLELENLFPDMALVFVKVELPCSPPTAPQLQQKNCKQTMITSK